MDCRLLERRRLEFGPVAARLRSRRGRICGQRSHESGSGAARFTRACAGRSEEYESRRARRGWSRRRSGATGDEGRSGRASGGAAETRDSKYCRSPTTRFPAGGVCRAAVGAIAGISGGATNRDALRLDFMATDGARLAWGTRGIRERATRPGVWVSRAFQRSTRGRMGATRAGEGIGRAPTRKGLRASSDSRLHGDVRARARR